MFLANARIIFNIYPQLYLKIVNKCKDIKSWGEICKGNMGGFMGDLWGGILGIFIGGVFESYIARFKHTPCIL